MKALFEVGEEVILQSKNNPQYNGTCTVLLVCEPLKDQDGVIQIGYKTTISGPPERLDFWAESALKKKHAPGDSFESMISSLKDQTIASHIDDKAKVIAEQILNGDYRDNRIKED